MKILSCQIKLADKEWCVSHTRADWLTAVCHSSFGDTLIKKVGTERRNSNSDIVYREQNPRYLMVPVHRTGIIITIIHPHLVFLFL